ncbi:MAG: polysaccharide deacetylase family protein [Prevotella sp.]|nr:polysaccharide deacetylase family protein [Prevotella sp.]
MNILTFDIEDWYNHDDYSRDFAWEKHEVRIYEGTEKILTALDERGLKGTFFCVGWLAEHHPKVIQWIAERGHHLGCHSYQHELATRFTREEFKTDTYKAKCLIEDVAGLKVNAFRVPSFSITHDNLWAFDVLAELGFKYDSSVFPSHHEFGGLPDFPSVPHIIRTQYGDLKEYPISLGKLLGREIVYSGGGYFRVMPYWLLKRMTSKADYVLSYFHPSDFDPNQPKMPQLPKMRQFKNRVALKGAYEKYKRYIADFEFVNLLDADARISWDKQRIEL